MNRLYKKTFYNNNFLYCVIQDFSKKIIILCFLYYIKYYQTLQIIKTEKIKKNAYVGKGKTTDRNPNLEVMNICLPK